MFNTQNVSLFLLRLSLGWLFFYAGITKVLDSSWSAAGYIKGAQVLPHFFASLLQSGILPIINLVNEWGLVLLGVSLILGVFLRISTILGALLMLLYFLAAIKLPVVNFGAALVDQHIIFIFALLTLFAFDAGRIWGLGNKLG
jgi:thiosulfate dehydrogenase [quinone] large subunit